MSGEPTGSNGIRTSWPDFTADVANGRRLAQRVATRAGDDENHRLHAISNKIEELTTRIADREVTEEQRDLEARARETELDARITSESDVWRRSIRSLEATVGQLQHEMVTSDQRTELLERELLRLRTENSELIAVLEGLFGSLASRGDVESLQQELEQSDREGSESLAELAQDISSVRTVLDEHSGAIKSFVSQSDVELLHGELEESMTAALERRYVELRERVEEARVTAEKAADRADFASDGISVVQADVEEELAELRERLQAAPSEADLRAEFAAVSRKEIRTQAEQLAAIRAELDQRLASSAATGAVATKSLRRWQQWIDLPEREIRP